MRRGAGGRSTLILLAVAVLAVGTLCAAPLVGVEHVPLGAVWSSQTDPGRHDIFWKIRVPRVALGFLGGAGLAAAGLAFQAMFRNPLATPYTLGVAGGASLGATVTIYAGWSFAPLGVPATSLGALAGAVASIALVYALSRARRGFSTATMLLAGVALSFFFSSLVLLLQYLSDFTQTFRILRWLIGGLDSVVPYDVIALLLPLVAAGCAAVILLAHELNLLSIGEELAAARGVSLQRTRIVIFVVASLVVGGIVACCGPIGFVGLIAPHICRLLVGPDHRRLAPAAILFGGAFLVGCDTVARTAMAPTELPVGIITAALGGPFFLWLLLRERPT